MIAPQGLNQREDDLDVLFWCHMVIGGIADQVVAERRRQFQRQSHRTSLLNVGNL